VDDEVDFRDLLSNTYTGEPWQDELLEKKEKPMPGPEDSYFSIPKKKGLFIPGTVIAIATILLTGGPKVYDVYCDWRASVEADVEERKDLEERLRKLEAIADQYKKQGVEKRIDMLEQWQCRLGWNPPESRSIDRVCSENEDGVGE
jgi:hypothetical protein